MSFCPTQPPTYGDYLIAISLIFTVIAGIFILRKWSKSIKIKRAEIISQIIAKFWFDDEIADTSYQLESNEPWYDEDFLGSEKERKIDKLFYYLSLICYLRATGNISEKEFKILHYVVVSACKSFATQLYLWDLYHFSTEEKKIVPFGYLIEFGFKNKILPSDFHEKDCAHYVNEKLPIREKRRQKKGDKTESVSAERI